MPVIGLKNVFAATLCGCVLSTGLSALKAQKSGQAAQPVSSRQAQDVLTKMIATYRQMDSFSLKAGTCYGIALGTTIDFQKPNKVAVTFYGQDGVRRAICDGKYIYAFLDKDKMRYERKPAPPDREAITQTLITANSPAFFTAAIFTASKWQDLGLKSLVTGKPADFMGTPVDVVNAAPAMPEPPDTSGSFTLQIGRDDHLLREVDIKITEQGETQMMNETHGNKCLTAPPIKATVIASYILTLFRRVSIYDAIPSLERSASSRAAALLKTH